MELHFNRIVGNGQYGLYDEVGLCFAENNWWGSNNPTVGSSSLPCDISFTGGEIYYPWLVLTVTPTSYKVVDGRVYEATVTADLNHNSNGEYLSTLVHVPDGVPINFTTDSGNINSTGYTINGEASATLVLDPNLQSGLTNITSIVDGQSISTTVDRSANAIIYINSTAIDLSTGQPLSLYYKLPLNESVSWVSVLWKSISNDFGTFQNEVNLIVNGVVVLNRTVSNINYLNNSDLFSQKVWYNVNYLNWLFSESTESKMALQSIINQTHQLQNLTGSELETGILDIIKESYGFTDSEMAVVANYRDFIDSITTYVEYPGDAHKRITVEDLDTGEFISLNFGGNPIYRSSTMIYVNGGYYHPYGDFNLYRDAGYEGVRSFAIVTTKVTDEILRYWLDQENKTDGEGNLLYSDGPMRAAYGTFLSSLLMIKAHDMVADQAAAEYNVTWSRTTPIVVSVFDDAYYTVLTLECDHRFGMDVIGDPEDVLAFRYACSAAINPIEHWVMETLFPGDVGRSITIGLGRELLNGQMPDIFVSNGYLVMKSSVENMFLVFDPETGILRDVMMVYIPISGAYCFSDLQTEWASDLANILLLNTGNMGLDGMGPPWMNFILRFSMGINPFGLGMGVSPFGYGMETSLTGLFVSLGVSTPVAQALAGSTRGARNPLSAALIGTFITVFVGGNYLCDKYGWIPPRNFNEDCEMVKEFLIMSLAGPWWDYKKKKREIEKRAKQKKEEDYLKNLLHLPNFNIGAGPDRSKLFKALLLIGAGALVTYKVFESVDMRIIYDLLFNETNSTNNSSIHP